jgi:diguanylate cyclase (GGDEF)-like protein
MMKKLVKQPKGKTSNLIVEKILRYVEPAHPEMEFETVFARFTKNKNLRAIPVVKNGRPVGLIVRYEFVDNFDQPLRRVSPGKSTCADMMNSEPLLVEKSTPIHELSGFLSESDIKHFSDGFIITEQGRYIGIGTVQDLLREITKVQLEITRYANPLTLLPGSVPINEHIEHLLHAGKNFVVCYSDLNHFKAFNDVYDYQKGDEVIQFTGELLSGVCDPVHDFIGHPGGDDFILVMQSKDWESRCNRALAAFAQTSSVLFDKEHRAIGGYLTEDRQSRIVHHPLPTLSIGVIRVIPNLFGSHYEIVEASITALQMAKKKPGNSLFIERRRIQPYGIAEQSNQGKEAQYG